MDHGLQFSLAYTYSHALDDGSGYESTTGGLSMLATETTAAPGTTCRAMNISTTVLRTSTPASASQPPTFTRFRRSDSSRKTGSCAKRWRVGDSAESRRCKPDSPSRSAPGLDRSLWCDGGSKFQCPDVPNTSSFNIARYNPRKVQTQTPGTGNYYFNTAPFSLEPVGTFGNTSRNFFHGPGFNYTNLSVTKDFPFSADKSRYVQLRLEGFNVFNHANFAAPNPVYSSPTFGQVTSVIESAEGNGDPSPGRAVQLAGKIYF